MTPRATILIVEDDDAIATGLALNLQLAGYGSARVQDGEEALRIVREGGFDLILLDMNLPRKDGLQVLHELRTAGDLTPVVVVSARLDEYDKVAALRLGADDYVTKPFALAELMARVEAVLRRAGPSGAPRVEAGEGVAYLFGDVSVDANTRTVTCRGETVSLTHLEFELLAFFLRHPSRVFSRNELLRSVWGQQSGSRRTVDNFVGQLRAKLESDPEHPRHFITVRGTGYRFDR
jgi:two-component system, OmpR family, alkaline phosphatase synthesis response regulator PhoP